MTADAEKLFKSAAVANPLMDQLKELFEAVR
jgi:hypothetical protein